MNKELTLNWQQVGLLKEILKREYETGEYSKTNMAVMEQILKELDNE